MEDAHLHFAVKIAAGGFTAATTTATASDKGQGGGEGRGSTNQTKRGLPNRRGVHECVSRKCCGKISTPLCGEGIEGNTVAL